MFQINWKIKAFLYRVLFFLKVEKALFFIQKKITKSANINIDKVNENWKYHLKYLQSFNSITVLERAFTVAEAKGGAEAFMTSTTNFVLPVIAIDGTPIGDGKPGPVTAELIAYYRDHFTSGRSTDTGRRR